MRDVALEEMFAEFEADTRTTLRPPGTPDAQRRVRDRRRRRRGLLAGVAAILLAGPASAFAVAGRDVDRHEPAPTESAGPRLVERKIDLPQGIGELVDLRFVNARHGWALFDTCGRTTPPKGVDCRLTFARTTDGGIVWTMSGRPPTQRPGSYLLPLDDRTLTVVMDDSYYVTTDGGTTFTTYPFSSPPSVTQQAMATASGFAIGCPSTGGVPGVNCQRRQLERIGAGAVQPQPPVALTQESTGELIEGGDGRLWLSVREKEKLSVLVSADKAATWRLLPAVEGAHQLMVSPDGRDAWMTTVAESEFGTNRLKDVWRLAGDRWEPGPGLPDDTRTAAAMNGGILAVTGAYGGFGFWVEGRYIDAPELRAATLPGFDSPDEPSIEVLPDDTVVVSRAASSIIGTGSGTTRTWTRLS
ncbi:hypothetical protein [Micromonospora arborensis]|uniref:hypothetical protein n=1 Tax=Micromonospora arborensis TaxID=2116518 RepID=UPI00371C3416